MTGAEYRMKAAQLFALAKQETDGGARRRLQQLALAYLDLGEKADRKIAYQTGRNIPALLDRGKSAKDK